MIDLVNHVLAYEIPVGWLVGGLCVFLGLAALAWPFVYWHAMLAVGRHMRW